MGNRRMKGRLCLLALCLMAVALSASALERPPLHPTVIALCQEAYPDYAITASDGFGNAEAGQWALVLSKAGQHVLVVAEKAKEEPAYRFTVENPNALMPGENHPSVLIDSAGDALFIGFQNTSHIWDFSAFKSQGTWGEVNVSIWEREGVSPSREWHMRVEDGQLLSSLILSDGNDNVLSSTSYPPFPVSHLAGKTALNDYHWADFPVNPKAFRENDSPERWAGLKTLLPAGWQLRQAVVRESIFLLGEDAQGDTRLIIKTWVPEGKGGWQDTMSQALPQAARMDGIHMSDGLLLGLGGQRDYAFHLQKGGLWGLSRVMVGDDWFSVGPDYLYHEEAERSRYLFGSHPWGDIRTVDVMRLPQSFEEALCQLDQSGWAKARGSRLNLRAAPDLKAKSLGQYYAGTPIKVLERAGDWARVDIAGVTGWMRADYLAFGKEANAVAPSFPERVGQDSLEGKEMPLYGWLDEAARPLYKRSINNAMAFWIIGIVGEEWYHVYFFQEGIGGYMKQGWFWEGNG